MTRRADPALPERRRRQILDAARECFRFRGFRLTTIEEICAEARLTPGALYRYFGSKADIVMEVGLELRGAIDAALDAPGDPIEALAKLTADEDAALRTEIWAEAAHDPVLAKALAEVDRKTRAKLAAVARRAGKLIDPVAAELLIAALDGVTLRQPADKDAPARFRVLAHFILVSNR